MRCTYVGGQALTFQCLHFEGRTLEEGKCEQTDSSSCCLQNVIARCSTAGQWIVTLLVVVVGIVLLVVVVVVVVVVAVVVLVVVVVVVVLVVVVVVVGGA